MNYYVSEFLGCQNGCNMYLIRLNYTPRKAGQLDEFGNAIADKFNTKDGKPRPIDTIQPEEREALKTRLKQGQGKLSLQEWDDFLADMVDLGLITNDQRHWSTGYIKDTPVAHDEIEAMWTGDPMKWLNDYDAFCLRHELLSSMGCRSGFCISPKRNALMVVSDLVKEILDQ